MTLTYSTSREDEHTHTIEDGQVRYWVTVPHGMSPAAVADDFAAGYHIDADLAGDAQQVIEVTVETVAGNCLGTYRRPVSPGR